MGSEVISVYAPAHIDPADSYGLIACELVRYISRMDIHVSPFAMGNKHHENQDLEVSSLCRKPFIPSRGGILLGYPTLFERYGELANMFPKIALTMFESSKIPQSWIEPLNKCDAVVVPSRFCSTVFQECGVTAPIHVIPLGVRDVYKPKRRDTALPFNFLAFLDRGKRKGGIIALEAFVKEFSDDPRVNLILKRRFEVPSRRVSFTNDNIETFYDDLSEQGLCNLYYTAHCLINPNKGEGFGLIPREFAATGGISLTTNWGGTADDIDQWGLSIDYSLERADWIGVKSLEGKDLGEWASPDIDDLRRKMRRVFEERDVFLQRAYNNASNISRLYSWEHLAYRIMSIWRNLQNGYRSASPTVTEEGRVRSC
jgi:glycosyltransferase involved in cell wall biosynthesis